MQGQICGEASCSWQLPFPVWEQLPFLCEQRIRAPAELRTAGPRNTSSAASNLSRSLPYRVVWQQRTRLHSSIVAGSSLSRASFFQLLLDNLPSLPPSFTQHSLRTGSRKYFIVPTLRLPVSSRPPAQEEEEKKLRSAAALLAITRAVEPRSLPTLFLPTHNLCFIHITAVYTNNTRSSISFR